MARLILHSEGKDNKEIEINGLVSIGRAFDNILCIQDKKVSRYQAVIEAQADGFYLSDLGSINGTTIGDEKVGSKRKLKDGDTIVVGGAGKIEFHADNTQTATPPSPEPSKPEAPAADLSLETTIPGESKQQAVANPAPRRSLGLMIAFIALPVLIIATVGALIFANSDNRKSNDPGLNGQLSNQGFGEVSISNNSGLSEADNKNLATNDNTSTTPIVLPDNTTASTTSLSLEDIRLMCQQLAANISGKNDYIFDPEFLRLVDRLTHDYLDVRVDERACRNIGIYCNAKNLPVPLGLVLAMQRSKFKQLKNMTGSTGSDDANIGFLMLPKSIAKGYITNKETEEAINNPERATEIGVAYLKEVVDKFRLGKEDFAFAVAYYGEDIGKIGEGTVKLDELYAEPRTRQNFWKAINSRQLPLPAKASENIARFFAAGIVGENPKRFSLSRNPLTQF